MLSTVVVIATFLFLFILQFILWAFFLRLGLQWARVVDRTTRGVVVATAIACMFQVILGISFQLYEPNNDGNAIFLGMIELAAGILVPCLVISRVFESSFLRSLQAWFPTLLAQIVMVLMVFGLLRPFICESFLYGSNAMAPTIVGDTWRSTCPACGQTNYGSPVDIISSKGDRTPMICDNFHVNRISDVRRRVFPSDRFLVAKFLRPKRWDIVAFQFPENPKMIYAMRLVGLPGETIHIEGGEVWANGNKLERSADLSGIEYLSDFSFMRGEIWGSKSHPAVLGKDEYFVLGDFSERSADSRLWEHGAPGHSPFAVPESHVRGVVSHIYWPPERWRILR